MYKNFIIVCVCLCSHFTLSKFGDYRSLRFFGALASVGELYFLGKGGMRMFFVLVIVVACIAGVVGIIDKVGPLIGPSLFFSAIIIGIALLIRFKNKFK